MLNCFNERIEIEKTTKINININDLYLNKKKHLSLLVSIIIILQNENYHSLNNRTN